MYKIAMGAFLDFVLFPILKMSNICIKRFVSEAGWRAWLNWKWYIQSLRELTDKRTLSEDAVIKIIFITLEMTLYPPVVKGTGTQCAPSRKESMSQPNCQSHKKVMDTFLELEITQRLCCSCITHKLLFNSLL